jgi:hypothetical protein
MERPLGALGAPAVYVIPPEIDGKLSEHLCSSVVDQTGTSRILMIITALQFGSNSNSYLINEVLESTFKYLSIHAEIRMDFVETLYRVILLKQTFTSRNGLCVMRNHIGIFGLVG